MLKYSNITVWRQSLATEPNVDLIKFIYSEKTTKFCKSTVEISQNFVAFSEYVNFKVALLSLLCVQTRENKTRKFTFLPSFEIIIVPFCLTFQTKGQKSTYLGTNYLLSAFEVLESLSRANGFWRRSSHFPQGGWEIKANSGLLVLIIIHSRYITKFITYVSKD